MKALVKSVARTAVHTALGPMEARLLSQHTDPGRWPHIFILGAPRSGTSLFYELLVMRYRFAYFSNLAHRFWKTPVAASRLGRRMIERHKPAYRSDYGHISGWSAPNEGGWIWQRWLEDGPWMDETGLSGLPVAEMRATLCAMSGIFDAPFVNKNVMHSNRLRLLDAVFPGCLFIEIRRDPKDTARSIIHAQRRDKGPARDSDQWWSVRPSNAGGADLIERACRQVTGVAADIARDSEYIGRGRLCVVDYAALCTAPAQELARVAGFLDDHGVGINPRAPVPGHFTLTASKPLASEEESRLEEAFGGPATKTQPSH